VYVIATFAIEQATLLEAVQHTFVLPVTFQYTVYEVAFVPLGIDVPQVELSVEYTIVP
jgi:hypothetical protein